MKIKSFLNNPILRYKLDPGEPGLATPTPASRSIAKVASHEASNIQRFKKEAIQEGGIVVYSSISLNLSYQGSFLAATSGKSKALIVYPVKKEKIYSGIFNTEIKNKNEINIIDKNNIKPAELSNNSEKNINQKNLIINEEIIKISSSIKQLENEKLSLLRQVDRNKNDKQSKSVKINLYEKINRINRRIDQLKQEIKTENLISIYSNLLKSEELNNKFIKLKYSSNLKDSITGIYVDKII